jgi:hypothetical protein
MNLVESVGRNLVYDVHGLVPNFYADEARACGISAVTHPWTIYAKTKHPAYAQASPDGLIVNYRQACTSFHVVPGDPDFDNYWEYVRKNKTQSTQLTSIFLSKHLMDAILDETAKFAEVEMAGDHRRRLTESSTSAVKMVTEERQNIDDAFRQATTANTQLAHDLKNSFIDTAKDSSALLFISLFLKPSCYPEIWNDLLVRLFAKDDNGNVVFVGSRDVTDLILGGFYVVGNDVSKLEATSDSYNVFGPHFACYLAPAKLTDSSALIEILERRYH